MKTKIKVLATSITINGLTKMVQEYFYSPSYYIQDDQVYNSKGKINGYGIRAFRGRYQFFSII